MSMLGEHVRVKSVDLGVLRALGKADRKDQFHDFMNMLCDEGLTFQSGKYWHRMHALLAGDPWKGRGPLARVFLGGKRVLGKEKDDWFSYGQPLLLTNREVHRCHEALKGVSARTFRKRFKDPKYTSIECYPGGAIEGHDPDEHIQLLREVKELFRKSLRSNIIFRIT